ncbi:ester cyclase [Solirubrobacter soli]|uniref:ester cyclase n=1 Tax=Solirubrobacter soli TaxID=363832 RepID=UPI0004041876|nr:ester cyclase [Solirubrobacter soli]
MNHNTGRKRRTPPAPTRSRRGPRCARLRDQELKRIVHRYYHEVLTLRRVDVLDGLVAADFTGHDGAGALMDRYGLQEAAEMLLDAFPDLIVTVEDQVAEGNKVSTRWWASGTHAGTFAGISPTGRTVTISGIDIHRVERGRIAELWEELDVASLLAQML